MGVLPSRLAAPRLGVLELTGTPEPLARRVRTLRLEIDAADAAAFDLTSHAGAQVVVLLLTPATQRMIIPLRITLG